MTVIVDPIFMAPLDAMGGRLAVHGTLTAGKAITLEWSVNLGKWNFGAGPLDATAPFRFTIYGESPPPSQPEEGTILAWVSMGGGTFSADFGMSYAPELFKDGAAIIPKATSLANCQATVRTWWWDGLSIYYHPATPTPGQTVAIWDPVFGEGDTAAFRIREMPSGTVVYTSTSFVWPYPTPDYVEHMLGLSIPRYYARGARQLGLFESVGHLIADLGAGGDDGVAQAFVENATWGLYIWEKQMGLPHSGTIEERRGHILERIQQAGGTRTSFFEALGKVTPFTLQRDEYSNYRVLIRLGSDVNARTRAERLVADLKPVGIEVVLSYSTFIAGISKAGDSL